MPHPRFVVRSRRSTSGLSFVHFCTPISSLYILIRWTSKICFHSQPGYSTQFSIYPIQHDHTKANPAATTHREGTAEPRQYGTRELFPHPSMAYASKAPSNVFDHSPYPLQNCVSQCFGTRGLPADSTRHFADTLVCHPFSLIHLALSRGFGEERRCPQETIFRRLTASVTSLLIKAPGRHLAMSDCCQAHVGIRWHS